MNLQEKLAALEEIMDLEEGTLTPEASLGSINEWDSLAALSLVVLMTDKFNKKVTGAQIRAFKTVRDILNTMESA
ncbi:MAG: phosphopantetheine-binding protein [Candidatus Accumulibacter sp.]|jgi:acyl carrier protein|nr:phosphopantetheine-binding protein [Accumulibacter sp.]